MSAMPRPASCSAAAAAGHGRLGHLARRRRARSRWRAIRAAVGQSARSGRDDQAGGSRRPGGSGSRRRRRRPGSTGLQARQRLQRRRADAPVGVDLGRLAPGADGDRHHPAALERRSSARASSYCSQRRAVTASTSRLGEAALARRPARRWRASPRRCSGRSRRSRAPSSRSAACRRARRCSGRRGAGRCTCGRSRRRAGRPSPRRRGGVHAGDRGRARLHDQRAATTARGRGARRASARRRTTPSAAP